MIMEEAKKRCPYCGEEILAVAKKCKHCGEWLPDEATEKPKEKIPCPICGESIDIDLALCPYCHENTRLSENARPPKVSTRMRLENSSSHKKLMWIIIGILATGVVIGPLLSFLLLTIFTYFYRRHCPKVHVSFISADHGTSLIGASHYTSAYKPFMYSFLK